MPPTARTKRTAKSPATSSGLLYTTYEFIQRLRARGRTLRLDVRDLLLQWVQLRTDQEDAAALWDPECPDLQRHLSQVPPFDHPHAVCTLLRLCARLAPLQAYDLQYLNLAVVLHSLTPMEVKNLYRFCYLEWMAHHPSDAAAPTQPLWPYTPRQFAALHGAALGDAWEGVLEGLVSTPGNATERAPYGLFFVNRLYAYLTPCG